MTFDETGLSTTSINMNPRRKQLVLGIALALSGPVLFLAAIVIWFWELHRATTTGASTGIGMLVLNVALVGGAPASVVGCLVLIHWAKRRSSQRSAGPPSWLKS